MKSLHLSQLGDDPNSPFPPTREALSRPNGLLAWGGGLEPQRLLSAYRLGIFPWYSDAEPILWWSPSPRCVIFPPSIHLSRRTRRRYHSAGYHVTADTVFDQVVDGCAAPRQDDPSTWITTEMKTAYRHLHTDGYAHSIEVWLKHQLVGGIYGLALGKVFFGESMFSREIDASKIALVALCHQLESWQFGLLDCQVPNPHLHSLGAVELSRQDFEQHLVKLVPENLEPGLWTDRFNVSNRW